MLDDGETTIADIVAATHHTAAIGKWHIGPDGDADHPIDLGFEYYAGPLGNVDDYRDYYDDHHYDYDDHCCVNVSGERE